ncbi:hypothetical protein A8709_01960 [Paenibacillus pectinilyticus]|uniref:Uncharacterized protein n=1 Tax=Paenibacillus pectinilyticus TaxID=512399 RepID=A0A1C1A6T9_9BACL|nr:hypothetical protein [Paenibacillus pectinilyticus]OCT16228.1 hypothetical protein A8709_01960 [Paenibacillus pectinilyticus]
MPTKLLRPTKLDKGQGKALYTLPKSIKPTQRLSRFTVLWVNNAGVPFNTTGFVCEARTLGGIFIAAVRFDSFGTAVFNNIFTPTNRTLIIRTFNANGVLFRTRTVPARVAAYAIIG